MKYDLLVACGDSFTEGCKNVLNITEDETWPGLVANHYGIPYITLGVGGASNLEIALQPIQGLRPYDIEKLKSAKNPLFLFGFTVHERLAVADSISGLIRSAYTILPEHMVGHEDYRFLIKYATYLNTVMLPPCDSDVLSEATTSLYNEPRYRHPAAYNWYVHSTLQAIRLCMNWHAYFDNSTIKWGFLHQYNACTNMFVNEDRPDSPIEYPYISDCFNSKLDFFPLQVLFGEKDIISETDTHPNIVGIHKIKDFFISYIDGLSND